MSEHSMLVIVTGLQFVIGVPAVCFFAWIIWSLFWDVFDHLMQQRTRKRNNRFEARSTRDCFRDMKGLSK